MSKDLTNSAVDRQNILNNPYALAEIEKAAGIRGIPFEGKTVVLKEQVAAFFEVTLRTVENYLERNAEELARNGYEVISGKRLNELRLAIGGMGDPETNFGITAKTVRLGVLDFRAFLNLAMLMTESERAGLLRKAILDIVIDTINRRTGGGTKYINQRDEDFIHSAFIEEDYRKQFTDALKECVDMGNFKYALYTDKIYVSIFREKAQEYRRVLRLGNRANIRDTFYSEVLDVIASYECGFADALTHASREKGRTLTSWEVDAEFARFEAQAHWRPLIEKARNKMASRDLAFRDLREKTDALVLLCLQVSLFSRWQQADRHHALRSNVAIQWIPLLLRPVHPRSREYQLPCRSRKDFEGTAWTLDNSGAERH